MARMYLIQLIALVYLVHLKLHVVQGKTKLTHEKLLERKSKNGTKPMTWTTSEYNKFLKLSNDKPQRTYGVVALFTARGEEFKCQHCKDMEEQLLPVIATYGRARNAINPTPPYLYFVIMDFKTAEATFHENSIQSVPFITYFAPNAKNPRAVVKNRRRNLFTTKAITAYCNKKHKLRIPRPLNHMFTYGLLLVSVVVFTLIEMFVSSNPEFVKNLPWNKNVYMLLSFGVYFTSIGGMLFCIIRKARMYQVSSNNDIQYIHNAGRQQYVVEGLIVASINLFSGLSIIQLYRCVRRSVQISKTETNKLKRWMQSFFLWIQAMVYISILIYLLSQLVQIYSSKNRWYSVWRLMPDAVKRLFDRKNLPSSTGLKTGALWFDRVVRVAKFWLYKYSTWPEFQAKAIKIMKLKKYFS